MSIKSQTGSKRDLRNRILLANQTNEPKYNMFGDLNRKITVPEVDEEGEEIEVDYMEELKRRPYLQVLHPGGN